MSDGFAVSLGGNWYLDASGDIVSGAPAGAAQVYQPPPGFAFTLEQKWAQQVREVANQLSGILPTDDQAKKKWLSWGVPTDVVDLLGKIAGVTGILAKALSVYAWGIGLMLSVMKLMSDDDGMSPQLAKALGGIKNQLQAREEIENADQMISMHSRFDGHIDRISGLVTRLAVEQPTGAARAAIFAEMKQVVDELSDPLAEVRNQQWQVTYDPDDHVGREFAHWLLVFQHADGSTSQVPPNEASGKQFDYRLGVPMLLYASSTFASLMQIAMPWSRSAGIYADTLRKTADAIDRFVLRMQNESLARTQYSIDAVLQEMSNSIEQIPMRMNPFRSDPFAVGAFDLVRYDDQFLNEHAGGERGFFDYHWHPPSYDPATNELHPHVGVTVEEVNDKSTEQYAKLQAATGVLELVKTAAWLRFLSTPPDHSETVSGATKALQRFTNEKPTTATSPNIRTVGVIEHPATLRQYAAYNRVTATTQEPGYVPEFGYRIVLRTLRAEAGAGAWQDLDYAGDVWVAGYEKTAGDPRVLRLRTEVRRNWILDEIVLFEGKPSAEPVHREGDQALQAATYDWYVPVVGPLSINTGGPIWMPKAPDLVERTVTGGSSIHLLQNSDLTPILGGTVLQSPGSVILKGPLDAASIDDLGVGDAFDRALAGGAERRHVTVEQVRLRWQLDWKDSRLVVQLYGRPEDRPFQVHVVVEETVYSGEWTGGGIPNPQADPRLREALHTPLVAEMVNQLVFVPEEFFDKEREALKKAAKAWGEFLHQYLADKKIHPGDPIDQLNQSIRNVVLNSQSTATIAAVIDMQADFAEREAPELWQAALGRSR